MSGDVNVIGARDGTMSRWRRAGFSAVVGLAVGSVMLLATLGVTYRWLAVPLALLGLGLLAVRPVGRWVRGR